MQYDFQHFLLLKEGVHQLNKLTEHEVQLAQLIKKQEKHILELEVKVDMEQEDVDKLMKMSLKYLFYTILRSKEEQLSKERREVLEATLRLQEAKMNLEDYKLELNAIKTKITELSAIPKEYDELMRRKEILLRTQPGQAHILEEMEIEISKQGILQKEIKEALREGKGVISLLTDASKSLEKAEDWGNWDLWLNGGMISTFIKHDHIDDARAFIHSANRQLERFHKELADLKQTIDIQVDISGLWTLADYLLDGFIVDWIVQDKIENAQQKALDALHKLRPIVSQLESELLRVSQQIENLKQKRTSWIEQVEYKR